ncbi:transcription initiation factor TFIID subunit 15 [Tanacetum coccineum]
MANYSAKGAHPNGSVNIKEQASQRYGYIETSYSLGEEFAIKKCEEIWATTNLETALDKVINEPKGDAAVTYKDPYAAQAAVEWFNNKEFHGTIIEVLMAESTNSHNVIAPLVERNLVADIVPDKSGLDMRESVGMGRGRCDASGNAPPKQDSDWMCPNTSCTNVSFAFRGVRNRCGSARPAAGDGAGGGGVGAVVALIQEEVAGMLLVVLRDFLVLVTGLIQCKYKTVFGNINWAKRFKCNICNINKPGVCKGV